MKYLKNFFRIFGSSLFPTDKFYKSIHEHKLSFSLKYFFTLVVLISLFTNMATYGVFYPKKSVDDLKMGAEEFLNSYPKDLKVSIQDGNLITNQKKPIRFWWTGVANPLLVIDETADLQKMVNYKALMVLNDTQMLVKKYNLNEYEIAPISQEITTEFNYSYIQYAKKTINEIYTLMPFLWTILLVLMYLVVPIILTAIKMTYLILISGLIFLIFKFINAKIEFFKVFQLSLHSSTLPTVLGALFALSIESVGLQGLFLGLTLIFLGSAVYEVYIYKEAK